MVVELAGFPTDLGSILVRMGAVTWDQLHIAVEYKQQLPDVKLGELLVREGFLTSEVLKEALELQSNLRTSKEVPVSTLTRIYNLAVENFQRNNVRLGSLLDGHSKR